LQLFIGGTQTATFLTPGAIATRKPQTRRHSELDNDKQRVRRGGAGCDPELKGVTQAACVRFRDELMAYRMMLESMEGDHRHVSSVSMIQPTLLMSLFVIGA
jgi:hypothetical protein